MKPTQLALALLVAVAPALRADEPSTPPLAPTRHSEIVARAVAFRLPRFHFSHQRLDGTLAERAFHNYLNSLDFDHTFFLQSDIDTFAEELDGLDRRLRAGDLRFAFDVFDVFRNRVKDRVAFAREVLEEPFDPASEDTWTLKRREAPWPQDAEDQDRVWRKKLRHQYLSHRIARELEAEKADADGEEGAEDAPAPLHTPQEAILRSLEQFRTVILGHDEEWVVQQYLDAFARAYDTHTNYMSARALEDFDIGMKLSLTGIGAVLSLDDGAAKVERLVPGGPADLDGRLQPGDRIIGVGQDDEDIVDTRFWPLYRTVRLIRGEVDSKVRLQVVPASDPTGATVSEISLVRDHIRLEERGARAEVRELPGGEDGVFRLGVITVPDFYSGRYDAEEGVEPRSSARDVRRLLEELRDKVDGVLLDLRNNGGGSLPEAVEMTRLFLPAGPVVQVKSPLEERLVVLGEEDAPFVYGGPVVVLVNRLSASASEILAAALQDHGRALVVGDSRTHGKGSVQTLIPLHPQSRDFGAVKVTTAGFFRVSGGSTQLRGVTPDIVVPSALDVMEIGEEYLPNVLPWSEIDPLEFKPLVPLADIATVLETGSRSRRERDARFTAYETLVGRLGERLRRETVPLDYELRLDLARRDRKVEELQEDVLRAASPAGLEDDDDAKPRADLILDEALNILRDYVGLLKPTETAASDPG